MAGCISLIFLAPLCAIAGANLAGLTGIYLDELINPQSNIFSSIMTPLGALGGVYFGYLLSLYFSDAVEKDKKRGKKN